MSLQAPTPRLILASASQARSALLRAASIHFEARSASIDEADVRRAAEADGLSAQATALRLATLKAECVAASDPEALVIGCDQLLVCENDWLEKPVDVNAARAQLRALHGRTHVLVTAVACWQNDGILWQHVAEPRLTMRRFSDPFLEDYLALERDYVTKSVGAYRLEGPGIHLFEAIEGEHAAILGLPLLSLLAFLRRHGMLSS
jgi:septum formation protein